MIYAEENADFTAVLWNQTTGLTGTLTVGIFNPQTASYVVSPTTSGITETPAGSGVYLADLTCPPVLEDAAIYLILWDDPAMDVVAEELRPVAGVGVESPSSLPSVADVGALLRARTKDLNGTEIGTFDDDTRPTGAQVQIMMAHAADEVYAELGAYDDVPTELKSSARRLVALRTAMLVELSYFPEQVQSGRSPYEHIKDLYEAALPRMVEATRESVDGGEHAAGAGIVPRYSFPVNEGGMIGNGSEW